MVYALDTRIAVQPPSEPAPQTNRPSESDMTNVPGPLTRSTLSNGVCFSQQAAQLATNSWTAPVPLVPMREEHHEHVEVDSTSATRAPAYQWSLQPVVKTLAQDGLIKIKPFSMSGGVNDVLSGFCEYLALCHPPS